MKVAVLLSLFIILGLSFARAEAPCNFTEVCTISRDLKSDGGKTVSVPYTFKYKAPKNGAPVVVVIPGGPGQTSIPFDYHKILNLPEDFGIIQTDPMFVGANNDEDMKSFKEATTSEQVAKDIQLALQSVGAKDVIIYGGSYGTVPGTILASQLSKAGPAPRAVILDGTAGRYYTNEEAVRGYKTQWERVKSFNREEDLKAFNQMVLQLKTEGQLNVEELTSILQMLLIFDSHKLSRIIHYAGRGEVVQAKSVLLELKDRANQPHPEDDKWFHGVISCKEIFPESNPDTASLKYNYQDGFEVLPPTKDCDKYASKASIQLYDSKNYQISAPVIYLQGEYDPATPKEQALYHAKNQKNQNRIMKVVPGGKHISLMNELRSCSQAFFKALQTKAETASQALEPCIEKERALNQPALAGSK